MSALRNLAKGARNQKAFENLIKHYQNYDERPDNVGNGNPKPEQIELFVHFFGQDFKADLYYEVKGTAGTWNTHKDKFAADEELTAYNAIVSNFKTNGKIPQGTRVSRIKEKI